MVLELKAKDLAESIVQIVSSSEFRDLLISASFDHQDLTRLRSKGSEVVPVHEEDDLVIPDGVSIGVDL